MFQTINRYLTPDLKMADVLLNNPYLILLLEHFEIDVPLQECSLHEVCVKRNINPELFLTFANLYNGVKYISATKLSFSDTHTIINYLKNSHKYYAEEIYPNVLNIIKQMKAANDHKEMALVEKFFVNYFDEVREHLNYENEIVFPYFIELYEQIVHQSKPENLTSYAVQDYKEHHGDIEEKLNDLKNLLIKYLPQKNDQPLRRKLLFNLFELEYDLNIHSQIEDLILIPLVAEMELHINASR